MKKILSMFTAAFMLFAFASCGGGGGSVSSETASNGDASTDNASGKVESSTESTESSSEATNTGTYAPQENGEGNTTLSGIVIKDQDGDGVIRVACLGDSITSGNVGNNWPLFLQEYLDILGKTDGNTYEVHNHGKGGAALHYEEEQVGDMNWGWSTVVDEDGDGKAYFYYDDVAYTTAFEYVPDVVIVQMGTNDALGSGWKTYLDDDYYNHLVKPFADQGATVILSTPPYASNGMHDTVVNGEMHDREVQMAWNLGLPIVDTNRLLYGWKEVFADGLHGNTTGYSLMALNFYKYIFGGDPSTITIKAEPNTKVTLLNEDIGRSYVRITDEQGNAVLDMTPAEATYKVVAECVGFLTNRSELTVSGDCQLNIELKASENVALMGTPFACDAEVYQGDSGPNNADNIIDGELTAGGYQPASYNKGDYVGVEFDEAKEVTNINIYWETAAYISTFENDGFEVWFKIGGDWEKKSNKDIKVSRESYTGDVICDVITVDPAESIEGVKIVFLDGDIADHKYAPKLYELEVFVG